MRPGRPKTFVLRVRASIAAAAHPSAGPPDRWRPSAPTRSAAACRPKADEVSRAMKALSGASASSRRRDHVYGVSRGRDHGGLLVSPRLSASGSKLCRLGRQFVSDLRRHRREWPHLRHVSLGRLLRWRRRGRSGRVSSTRRLEQSLRTGDPNIGTFEQLYPVRIEKHEMRCDSGGAGKYRGGSGVAYEVRIMRPVQLSFRGEGLRRFAPRGAFGCGNGALGHLRCVPDVGETYTPPAYGIRHSSPCRFSMVSQGGGGWAIRSSATSRAYFVRFKMASSAEKRHARSMVFL